MEFAASLAQSVVELWRSLGLSPFEKSAIKVLLVALLIYAVVYVAERVAGTRTSNYQSASFVHDLAYWFYYRTGIHDLIFMVAIVAALERPLSFVALDLFTPLPFAAQALLYLVIGDFIAYWIHRAEHHFKFMWAFHTTHHSQDQLTFATTARFHPVEMIYHNLLAYVPMRLMGIEPMAWLPLYVGVMLYAAIQHTQIPWKLGPFYKIIATPHFHAFHHSVDPEHHNKNFSNLFSTWDHLFGTAIGDDARKPIALGLAGVPATSLISSLTTPFRLLHQFYLAPLRRPRGVEKP